MSAVTRRSGAARITMLAVALPLWAAGCDYRLTTHARALPPRMRIVAVPAFVNHTRVPQLSQMITAATERELLTRTHARVQSLPAGRDALLRGTLLSATAAPITFDPITNRATTVRVRLRMAVQFVDERSGRVLYSDPALIFTGNYQISEQTQEYIEEDALAWRRLSRRAARDIVAAILDRFHHG